MDIYLLSFADSFEQFFITIWQWLVENRLNIGEIIIDILYWLVVPIALVFIMVFFMNIQSEKDYKKSILSYRIMMMWRKLSYKYLAIFILTYSLFSVIWPEFYYGYLLAFLAVFSVILFLIGEYKLDKLKKYTYLLQKNNVDKDILINLFEVISVAITAEDVFVEKKAKRAKFSNKDIIRFSTELGRPIKLFDLIPKNVNVEMNIDFIIEQLSLSNEIKNEETLLSKQLKTFNTEELTHSYREYIDNNPHFIKVTLLRAIKETWNEVVNKIKVDFAYGGPDFISINSKLNKKTKNNLDDMIFLNKNPDDSACTEINFEGRNRLYQERTQIYFSKEDDKDSKRVHFRGPDQYIDVNLITGKIEANENSKPKALESIVRKWLHSNIDEIIGIWNKTHKNDQIDKTEVSFISNKSS